MSIDMLISKKRISFTSKVNGKSRKVLVSKQDNLEVYTELKKLNDLNRSVEYIYGMVKSWVDDNLVIVKQTTPQYYYIIPNPN